MEEKQQADYTFPLASFLAQRASIQTERQRLARERAAWKKTRATLDEAAARALDEQFRDAFEALRWPLTEPYTPAVATAVDALQALVAQGAAAHLLGHHELGSFNLAMAIRSSEDLKDDDMPAVVCRVVRLALVADADLLAQKTYIGNGGCTGLEWLVWVLSGSWHGKMEPDEDWQRTVQCCYTMFPWVLEADLSARHGKAPVDLVEGPANPLLYFLQGLRGTVISRSLQEMILLRLMAYNLSPVLSDNIYMGASFFKRIISYDVQWIGLIFPYEQEALRPYIAAVNANLLPSVLEHLMHALTSGAGARRYFRAFFSRPHWLLERVAEVAPGLIVTLVKHNEQELLKPFLKFYRPALLAFRDPAGNTLLHIAVMVPGTMKGMVTLLLQYGFPRSVKNDAGVTPGALAVKYKRKMLIPLL